jgi:hypothetical protein
MENIIIHCGSALLRMPNSFSNRLCWASNAKNVRWLLGEWSRNDKTIIVLNDRFTKKIKPFYTS